MQTLVENAVCHGIRARGDGGGRIEVRSRKTDSDYIIEVVDDGAGFDVQSLEGQRGRPEAPHLGLVNTRRRLELMCGGRLALESAPGAGTTARIFIPRALGHRCHSVRERTDGLYVRCFGSFEVFYDGTPVRFKRARSRELFAYLIDRRGASSTARQCCAVLFADLADGSEKQRNYFHHIWADLKSTMESLGCGGILRREHNAYSVSLDPSRCDYYLAMERGASASTGFFGEYMSQYSWAEYRTGLFS